VNNLPTLCLSRVHYLNQCIGYMAFNRSPWLIDTFVVLRLQVFFSTMAAFIFLDSRVRNQQCYVYPHGSIILLSFESTDTLLVYLHRVYRGHMFNLSVVHLCRRLSDCDTLEDQYLLTTLHIERCLDSPGSGYLKHTPLGVYPNVVSIENLSQSGMRVQMI